MNGFYDELASSYHLIFLDWDASIARQATDIDALIASRWPGSAKVLDVACGIGTQAIGLALRGYDVHASDLSAPAVERAAREAQARGATLTLAVSDMRQAAHARGSAEIVLCADNSLPHLLTDDDIALALAAMYRSLAPGGGCILTVRDYAAV
ncbi:MAG TPA: class I SAM-dependent methyltransferase, partial [Burkholderiaceae bacterium]